MHKARAISCICAGLLLLLSSSCSKSTSSPPTAPASSRPDADVVMITPFCDTSDVASVNEAFSSTSNAPWGFAHSGIDFFPTQNLRPFRSAAAGTVREFRLWQNGQNWQVNVGIQYNATYTVQYSFEPFSSVEADGQTQLANMRVTAGEKVARGDTIGYLYVAGGAAHVDFGLGKNNQRICPEPYFTPEARQAVLAVTRKTYPGAQMCY
jgi:murein DD-endopeptidase MepM/ murein hydrolase activator NlpD